MYTKQYRVFVLLVLFLFVSACSPSAQNIESEHWVIFSAEQSQEWGVANWFHGPNQPVEYWTPSEENVLDIEEGLSSFLQENGDRFYSPGTPVWERLDEYNGQYVGVILDGKQIIYANYFCDSAGKDWKEDFIIVMDGGDCFFQFKYNPETGEFFDLQVNGMA